MKIIDIDLTPKEINDFILKASWYFGPFLKKIKSINIDNYSEVDSQIPDYLSKEFTKNIPLIKKKINRKNSLNFKLFKNLSIKMTINIKIKTTTKSSFKQTVDLDPNRINSDSAYLSFFKLYVDNSIQFKQKNLLKLRKLQKSISKSKIYVLGTGPSFDSLKNYDFSDGEIIVCNSIVKNKQFLERWRPKLIVFGDPIFHAGFSTYGESFRKDLLDAVKICDPYIIVPERDVHIYRHYLPSIKRNIISINILKNENKINWRFYQNYSVTSTRNILTLLMLPFAAFLSNNIYIGGCDGRSLKNNEYFWDHDDDVQYTTKMSQIKKAHPGFFKVDYDDYYLEHCHILKSWILELEKKNKNIFNLTKTFIPVLNDRKN